MLVDVYWIWILRVRKERNNGEKQRIYEVNVFMKRLLEGLVPVHLSRAPLSGIASPRSVRLRCGIRGQGWPSISRAVLLARRGSSDACSTATTRVL